MIQKKKDAGRVILNTWSSVKRPDRKNCSIKSYNQTLISKQRGRRAREKKGNNGRRREAKGQ